MSKINNTCYIFFILFTISVYILFLSVIGGVGGGEVNNFNVFAQSGDKKGQSIPIVPQVHDEDLKVELVSKEFKFPTTFAFIGPNDFLILEKNTGEVKRVVNDKVLEKPLVKLNVSTNDERGLLGVAILKKEDAKINTKSSIII